MAEEKIVKINLRKRLVKVPKWRRKSDFIRLLKRRLKTDKIIIDQKLNEKIWASDNPKIRLKIVKDEKSVKAELVE